MSTATKSRMSAIVTADTEAESFSVDHPDGSYVVLDQAVIGLKGLQTYQVRGRALVINGKALVHLIGVSGAVPVSACSSAYTAWVKLNRKGQTNHWVQGWWINEQFMMADIQRQIDRDPRIESYEVRNTKPEV
ncbi:MAG: hypothetical protein U0930_03755 [Pirellulales bacterium]